MSERAMTCEEVLARVLDFVDRELAGNEAARLADHLESCRTCYSRVEFERRLKERLRGLSHEESPPDLQRRIAQLMKDFD